MTDYKVSPLIKTHVPGMFLKHTLNDQRLVLHETAREHDLSFRSKGGVLADEMGLGKTIEMLGLILSNPLKESPEIDRKTPFFITKATLGT